MAISEMKWAFEQKRSTGEFTNPDNDNNGNEAIEKKSFPACCARTIYQRPKLRSVQTIVNPEKPVCRVCFVLRYALLGFGQA